MTEERSAADISPSGEATKATIAKFAMAAIGFAGNIYFARVLGPERIGGFYLFIALAGFLVRPLGGVSSAIRKRASEAGTSIPQSIGLMGAFGIVWFLLVAAGVVLFRERVVSYTGISAIVLPFLVYFATEVIYGTFVPVLQGRGQIGFAYGMDAFRTYVEIPLQFVLVTLGYGVQGLIAGLITANVVAIPVVVRGLGQKPERPNRELVSRVANFAKFSVPSTVVGKAYGEFDTFLLGALLSQAVVGDYGVAARLTLPAVYLATSVSATTVVRISSNRSRGKDVSEDVTNALSFSGILAIPILFGAVVVAEPLINVVYGPAYAGAAIFLVAIGAQRVIESQTKVFLRVLDGLDRPDYTFKLSAVALAVNIPLGVVLVREIGGVGVVIATISVEVFRYVGAWWLVREDLSGTPVVTSTLIKQLFAAALMAGLVRVLMRFVEAGTVRGLLTVVGSGAIIYAAALLLISRRVRATSREVYGNLLHRLGLTQ